MSEPFVFHFKPGSGGHPQVLYMLDLDCQCHLCGHEQFQRFYHSTPFHKLTLVGLEDLADRGALKAGYECENCGEAVGANQVRHLCLSYGFSDDSGIIAIFDDLDEDTRTYELTANRRLDPQAMPRWSADPDAHEDDHYVVDDLDEETVEDLLDRPFNVKLAWLDLLQDWFDDPEGGAYCRVGPDLWIVIDEDESSALALADEIDDDEFCDAYDDGEFSVFSLHDSVPHDLPTHDDPRVISGRWSTWLPDDICQSIEDGELWADAYVIRPAAEEVLARAFDVARLDFERHETAADLFFTKITTPTDTTYGRGLPLSSVLRRAVYTGLTPGEAARLSAEEIIGVLLDIW